MSLTNSQMIAGRFSSICPCSSTRRLDQSAIGSRSHRSASHIHKATNYNARHADMFKATKAGAFVQRGKSLDCIDLCELRSF